MRVRVWVDSIMRDQWWLHSRFLAVPGCWCISCDAMAPAEDEDKCADPGCKCREVEPDGK